MVFNSIELTGLLKNLPPVEFCCVYGSSLLSTNKDKTSLVDYIVGVEDPRNWHAENLERNRNHYSRWMARLGPKRITGIADRVGVGVHFNPYVEWNNKMIKYGVVRMHDLALDLLTWDKFYLSGRLHKPVKKIVQGSFKIFQTMYKPILKEYADEGILEIGHHPCAIFQQDCGLPATNTLFSSLPSTIHKNSIFRHKPVIITDEMSSKQLITSREQASSHTLKAMRRAVLVSSTRQAVSGLLAAGGVNAVRYLTRKMSKALKSWFH